MEEKLTQIDKDFLKMFKLAGEVVLKEDEKLFKELSKK